MKSILDDNKMGALITTVMVAFGSVSIVGTTQFVMGLDGGNINGSIIACNYGACKDNTFNGGVTTGGGGGSSSNTAKLIVTKKVVCPTTNDCNNFNIVPGDFHITVTGDNPSPRSFVGEVGGTEVTLGAGDYKVDEVRCPDTSGNQACVRRGDLTFVFDITFSAECTGTINAGETKECVITNTQD